MSYLKCMNLLMQLALLLMLLKLMTVINVVALEFRYHNQKDVEKTMRNWTEQFPHLTHMYSIGRSVRGEDLWVIVMGQNASHHYPLVPNVKYIANMHGNELFVLMQLQVKKNVFDKHMKQPINAIVTPKVVGRELLLHLAEHLLLEYGKNESLTQFLNTTHLHIMPTMNPDGFAVSMEGSCSGLMGRGNALGYDLNRNFPDAFGTASGPEQRETQLIRDWIHSTNFVLSANLHGGALVVNYPFDSYPGATIQKYSASPDDDVFRHLSLIYSRSHPIMHIGSSCGDSFKDGITNGASWYPVYGGMQDYLYRNASGYELLIEVSCCKYPRAPQLRGFWERNKDALINLMFAVHMGVKGLILGQSQYNDSLFLPLEGAVVVVEGRESIQFRSSKYGEYFKLLLPGKYVLKVSYPNYQSTVTPFLVQDSVVTRLDIQLFKSDFNQHSARVVTTTAKLVVGTNRSESLGQLKENESCSHQKSYLSVLQQTLASIIIALFCSIL